MQNFFTSTFLIAVFLTETASAQRIPVAIEWSLPSRLPAQPGGVKALGVAGAVAGISNNVLMVAGGANFPGAMPWEGGKKIYHDQITVFSKKENQLSVVNNTSYLPMPVAYAATCITPKGILYAGGENETGIVDKAYLLGWDAAEQKTTLESLPSLPFAATNAAAVCIKNTVVVAGGEGVEGASDRCWSLDLNNCGAGWKELPPLPRPVSYAVCVALETEDGIKIYVLGGRRKTEEGISALYNSVYVYDLIRKSWSALKPLPYPLSAGSGVAFRNNTILLFSGDQGTTFSKVEQLLADMHTAQTAAEKSILLEQKNKLLLAHPGFSKTVLQYHVETGECTAVDTIPFDAPVTTRAFWWDNAVFIPSGEIRAGVRTPNIIMATFKQVNK